MLNVDEFESVFRAADKPRFVLEKPTIERVLVVHDLAADPAARYLDAVKKLLAPVVKEGSCEWILPPVGSWTGVAGVLSVLEGSAPDLVVSYRNLHSDAWQHAYSLGVYLNALTRGSKLPILVTPSPRRDPKSSFQDNGTDSVMVLEEHLTGADALISWGVKLLRDSGTLHLAHVENDAQFERFITAISKVREIDTDVARETILEQLLREPRDYIATVRSALAEAGESLTVQDHVFMAHRLRDYRNVVAEHDVDILVFRALEEDCLALHGNSYSLAVDLVDTPLLMV